MLKLCENGSNIDYLYETSSVLRKATETKISGLTFWIRFGTETKQKFKNSLHDARKNCQVRTGSAKKQMAVPPMVITKLLLSRAGLLCTYYGDFWNNVYT